jgi:hypothetical protein
MEFAGKEYRSLVSEEHFIDLCLEHGEIAVDVMKAAAALPVSPLCNTPCPTPNCRSSFRDIIVNWNKGSASSRRAVRTPQYYCECCRTNFD